MSAKKQLSKRYHMNLKQQDLLHRKVRSIQRALAKPTASDTVVCSSPLGPQGLHSGGWLLQGSNVSFHDSRDVACGRSILRKCQTKFNDWATVILKISFLKNKLTIIIGNIESQSYLKCKSYSTSHHQGYYSSFI